MAMARVSRPLALVLALSVAAHFAECASTRHHRHHREVSATEVRPATSAAFLSAAAPPADPTVDAPAADPAVDAAVDSEASASAEAAIAEAERDAGQDVSTPQAAFVQESWAGHSGPLPAAAAAAHVSAAQVGATKRKHVDVDNADEDDDNDEASDGADDDSEKDEQDEDKESSDTKDDDDDEEPPATPMAASFTIAGSEPMAAASSPSISNMVSASRPAVGAAAPEAPPGLRLSAARKEQVPRLKVVMPEKGDTLESVYGVGSGDMLGSVRTPEGYLTRARQRLQENLLQQARISALMQDMRNETGFQKRVDTDMTKLVAETQTSALAKMLGGMRKEMRQFARPFYLDHLDAEMRRLKAAECKLQEDLERAEAGMGAGQQGWPDAGERVIVKTSSFSRPRNTEENVIKKLRIDIPPAGMEPASLAQKSWSDEKAGAFTTARVSLGAIAAAFILAASAYVL